MAERLELVTDFATLRAGMIVVAGPCCACRRKHRGVLIAFESGVEGVGRAAPQDAWEQDPGCPEGTSWIDRRAVEQRIVWRVDDGLEDMDAAATTKKRERVK